MNHVTIIVIVRALLGGSIFTCANLIMKTFAHVSSTVGITAMQSIDVVVLNQ